MRSCGTRLASVPCHGQGRLPGFPPSLFGLVPPAFFGDPFRCPALLAGGGPGLGAECVLGELDQLDGRVGLIAGRLLSLALNRGIAGYGVTILTLYAIDSAGFVLAVAAIAMDRQV